MYDAVTDIAIDEYVDRMGLEILSLLRCLADIHGVSMEEEVAGLANAFLAPQSFARFFLEELH